MGIVGSAQRLAVAIAGALALQACGERQPQVQRIVETLEARVTALEKSADRLSLDKDLAEIARKVEYTAVLQPSDTGYSSLKTEIGVLVVQLTDIQPYANGSKVELTFGNPTAAQIRGLKLHLAWGGKELSERDHTLTDALAPGSWTTVTLPLDGVAPAQFTNLVVKYQGYEGMLLRGVKPK